MGWPVKPAPACTKGAVAPSYGCAEMLPPMAETLWIAFGPEVTIQAAATSFMSAVGLDSVGAVTWNTISARVDGVPMFQAIVTFQVSVRLGTAIGDSSH